MIEPSFIGPSELQDAFPSALSDDVAAVERLMPAASLPRVTGFEVQLNGERLTIPERIYNPEPESRAVSSMPELRQVILHSIYTRHHDGFVRQRHLEHTIGSEFPWVVPYVVRLVGEYVVEILVVIQDALHALDEPGSRTRETYGRFIAQNPEFLDVTRQRVASYWNCYYHQRFAQQAYPGFVLIASLEAAAAEMKAPDS